MMAVQLKTVTIYQPWASLVIAVAKPYEFRAFVPAQRGGRVAVKASSLPWL